jgi:hypothetical protein
MSEDAEIATTKPVEKTPKPNWMNPDPGEDMAPKDYKKIREERKERVRLASLPQSPNLEQMEELNRLRAQGGIIVSKGPRPR